MPGKGNWIAAPTFHEVKRFTYYEEGFQSITSVVAVIQLALVLGLLALERVTRPRLGD